MKIAIASGKGGTGKTTLSLNLARAYRKPIQLLDCDVEEPNIHLFLRNTAEAESERSVEILVPNIDPDRCQRCGECARFCQFQALVTLPQETLFFPELCHGCGGCCRVCPHDAITEVARPIGTVRTSQQGAIRLIEGRLNIGETMTPMVIDAVMAEARPDLPMILDAPPGVSCPVVATLTQADYAILVTEPTPFGLNDLKLAVELVREIALPFGVVINRHGMGDQRVESWCEEEKIEILAKIPNDRKVAEAYSRGEVLVDQFPHYDALLSRLFESVVARINSRTQIEQQGGGQ